MVDTPTTRKRLRKQGLGTNTNTWGDTKLNELFDALDQIMDGWLDIALTGDLTLTTTNYSTADQAKRRAHKFTGTLTAAAAVTYPSVEAWYFIWNASGAAVTVKLAASAGVTLQDGDRAIVFSNATEFYNLAPTVFPAQDVTFAGKLKGVTAGTAATDAVNKAQMETAISVLAGVLAGGLVLNSPSDLAAKYLQTAITAAATSGIVLTPTSVGTVDEYIAAALAINAMTAIGSNGAVGGDSLAGYDASAAAHKRFPIEEVVRRQTATQRFFATA